jgi:HSP20 family molecular chaperone IbpA
MAFFLTPRFAPAYTSQQCNPWACSPRPAQAPRRASRPSFPNFVPFLSQVDELLSEIDREARRQAHRQRQQRKRIARAHFNVHEINGGYQVDGEIAGFEQEHIDIEVTDDNTVKVTGDTDRKVDQAQASELAPEALAITEPAQNETMEGVTLNEPETERPTSPTHSEASSNKSYQATVEDDFEDLADEFAASRAAPTEPKGKEKVVDEPTANAETAVQQQPQPEAPAQQQQQPENDEWRFQGSFERTFRFPERIDAAGVRASLKNGLLSITVPKAKAPEVRRILIQ